MLAQPSGGTAQVSEVVRAIAQLLRSPTYAVEVAKINARYAAEPAINVWASDGSTSALTMSDTITITTFVNDGPDAGVYEGDSFEIGPPYPKAFVTETTTRYGLKGSDNQGRAMILIGMLADADDPQTVNHRKWRIAEAVMTVLTQNPTLGGIAKKIEFQTGQSWLGGRMKGGGLVGGYGMAFIVTSSHPYGRAMVA